MLIMSKKTMDIDNKYKKQLTDKIIVVMMLLISTICLVNQTNIYCKKKMYKPPPCIIKCIQNCQNSFSDKIRLDTHDDKDWDTITEAFLIYIINCFFNCMYCVAFQHLKLANTYLVFNDKNFAIISCRLSVDKMVCVR